MPYVRALAGAALRRTLCRAAVLDSVEGASSRIELLEVRALVRVSPLELFDELDIQPPTLILGSNGAIRESVQVGLGITLISLDAVARELDNADLDEWALPGGRRDRAWHVVGRDDEVLPPTARLFLDHLTAADNDVGDTFRPVASTDARR